MTKAKQYFLQTAVVVVLISSTILIPTFRKIYLIKTCDVVFLMDLLKKADKDNGYENLLEIKHYCSKSRFYVLLTTCIGSKNNDLFSLGLATRYIYENTDCRYLQNLILKNEHLKKIPVDSIWLTQIGTNHYRENGTKNSAVLNDLNRCISALEVKCNYSL